MPGWRGTVAFALLMTAALAMPGSRGESPDLQYQKAITLLRTGDFDSARKQSHEQADKYPGKVWQLRFRLIEAEALVEAGSATAASKLLDQVPDVFDPEYEIRRRLLKARVAIDFSSLNLATELVRETQTLAKQYMQSGLTPEIDILLGQILGRQSMLVDAEAAFRRVLSSLPGSADPYRIAFATNGVGMIRAHRSRCDEALPFFEEARRQFRLLHATYAEAGANNNLGMCYSQLGDFDRAIQYEREAVRLAKSGLTLANSLGETGTVHLLQHQFEQAIPHYRRAFSLAKQLGKKPDAARWAGNLASALEAVKNWDEADKALQEAIQLGPEPRSLPFFELDAAALAKGQGRLENAKSILKHAMDAAPDNPNVQWQASAELANIAMASGDFTGATAHFEAAFRTIEERRSGFRRPDDKLTFFSRLIQFYKQYVDVLMQQDKKIEALTVADASRARLLAERMPVPSKRHIPRVSADFEAIARNSHATWLSFWLAERSFLWVVTSEEVRVIPLPSMSEIAHLVSEYRGFIENSMRDPMQIESSAGRKLYEILAEPVVALVPAGSRLIIVPDGPLNELSFDALPVYGEHESHYWMDDYSIAIAPSFGVHRENSRAAALLPKVLAIGDPIPSGAEYPALPFAGKELSAVAARFPGTTVIRGGAAAPGAYGKSKPERYNIIHFASHAEANRLSPLDSAIVLSAAGASPRLIARDIMNIPLDADLVTLSACRSSGSRTYEGEGFVGLAWAFLNAGARSVVAGLWDVADESTSLLMENFYTEMGKSIPPEEALRRAKGGLRNTAWKKPYYWGPFQCYLN